MCACYDTAVHASHSAIGTTPTPAARYVVPMNGAPWWIVVAVSVVTLVVGQIGAYLVASKQADRDAKAREIEASSRLDLARLDQEAAREREQAAQEAARASTQAERQDRATDMALASIAALRAALLPLVSPFNRNSVPDEPVGEVFREFVHAMSHYRRVVDRGPDVVADCTFVSDSMEAYLGIGQRGHEFPEDVLNRLRHLDHLVTSHGV